MIRRPNSFWTEASDAELLRLQGAGLSCSQIAKRMGAASRNAVIARANRLRGVKFPSDAIARKKEKLLALERRRKKANLENDVIAAAAKALRSGRARNSVIREMARAGLNGAAIGRYFGVTHQRIHQILGPSP
jgi:hypothetical protein